MVTKNLPFNVVYITFWTHHCVVWVRREQMCHRTVVPRFCHMLKISQPIITLMSPYLNEERMLDFLTSGVFAHTPGSSTYFSRIFFLLEGEKDSSCRQGWLMNITDR